MKERNCKCELCKIESALRSSLDKGSRRADFHALTVGQPLPAAFDSPLSLIERLHCRDLGSNQQDLTDQILEWLIQAYHRGFENEVISETLGLAFIPALHHIYREVCSSFGGLAEEDVAQQAWAVFFHVLRRPSLVARHRYFSIAITRAVRKLMLKWAATEARFRSECDGEASAHVNVELAAPCAAGPAILLEELLNHCRRNGLLQSTDYDLLVKLKLEGLEAKEIAAADGAVSSVAVHHRMQRIMKRLRSMAVT
ncbi:MAG TPA: hypothetical protein VFZ08_14355 [Terriglobia bacterium]|nr:hypothetical protein [Terriglobia bacterium]